MTAAIEARGLGKQYGRRWALTDCTLSIPAGHVVGLVGPNGAGKTTLINLATGMLEPTTGTIEVLGKKPASDPGQLARVGYVAQDTPTYANLSVEDHLRFGAHMNPAGTTAWRSHAIKQLGLDLTQKAGKLSGGQRAQLALTLAIAKRPRAAHPGRANRQPGSARPAGVSADPDGGHGRARAQRRDVLPPRS